MLTHLFCQVMAAVPHQTSHVQTNNFRATRIVRLCVPSGISESIVSSIVTILLLYYYYIIIAYTYCGAKEKRIEQHRDRREEN